MQKSSRSLFFCFVVCLSNTSCKKTEQSDGAKVLSNSNSNDIKLNLFLDPSPTNARQMCTLFNAKIAGLFALSPAEDIAEFGGFFSEYKNAMLHSVLLSGASAEAVQITITSTGALSPEAVGALLRGEGSESATLLKKSEASLTERRDIESAILNAFADCTECIPDETQLQPFSTIASSAQKFTTILEPCQADMAGAKTALDAQLATDPADQENSGQEKTQLMLAAPTSRSRNQSQKRKDSMLKTIRNANVFALEFAKPTKGPEDYGSLEGDLKAFVGNDRNVSVQPPVGAFAPIIRVKSTRRVVEGTAFYGLGGRATVVFDQPEAMYSLSGSSASGDKQSGAKAPRGQFSAKRSTTLALIADFLDYSYFTLGEDKVFESVTPLSRSKIYGAAKTMANLKTKFSGSYAAVFEADGRETVISIDEGFGVFEERREFPFNVGTVTSSNGQSVKTKFMRVKYRLNRGESDMEIEVLEAEPITSGEYSQVRERASKPSAGTYPIALTAGRPLKALLGRFLAGTISPNAKSSPDIEAKFGGLLTEAAQLPPTNEASPPRPPSGRKSTFALKRFMSQTGEDWDPATNTDDAAAHKIENLPPNSRNWSFAFKALSRYVIAKTDPAILRDAIAAIWYSPYAGAWLSRPNAMLSMAKGLLSEKVNVSKEDATMVIDLIREEIALKTARLADVEGTDAGLKTEIRGLIRLGRRFSIKNNMVDVGFFSESPDANAMADDYQSQTSGTLPGRGLIKIIGDKFDGQVASTGLPGVIAVDGFNFMLRDLSEIAKSRLIAKLNAIGPLGDASRAVDAIFTQEAVKAEILAVGKERAVELQKTSFRYGNSP